MSKWCHKITGSIPIDDLPSFPLSTLEEEAEALFEELDSMGLFEQLNSELFGILYLEKAEVKELKNRLPKNSLVKRIVKDLGKARYVQYLII